MQRNVLTPLTLEATERMLDGLAKRGANVEYNTISGNTKILGFSEFEGDLKIYLLAMAKSYLNKYGFSHSGLEDFLLSIAQKYCVNPVKDELLVSYFWDKKDRLNHFINSVMKPETAQEAVFIKKWLHQALSLAFNDDNENPRSAAGVLVFHGKQDIRPLLEKLALQPENFTEKTYIDLKDKDNLQRATSTWITELDGIYPEAKSFFLARQDMHRPMFAKVDMPKARRTSFCVNLAKPTNQKEAKGSSEVDGLDPIFWPVKTDNIDMELFAELDNWYITQLWLQVYEELYLPNPKGYTLTARPDQENSAIKFFTTQMRFIDEGEKSAERDKIYAAYQAWCEEEPEDRVMKREVKFFRDIENLISDLCLYSWEAVKAKEDDKSRLIGFTFVGDSTNGSLTEE